MLERVEELELSFLGKPRVIAVKARERVERAPPSEKEFVFLEVCGPSPKEAKEAKEKKRREK